MTLRSRGTTRRARVGAIVALFVILGVVAVAGYLFQPWRLWTTTVATEPPPAGRPASVRVVAAGDLRSLAHRTTGRVRLVALPDGSRAVRIEGLTTSDGPDLRVWLSNRPAEAADRADKGRRVDLGPLRGNRGDLTYPLPPTADPADWTSLVIWCRRFSVGFGAAPLTPA